MYMKRKLVLFVMSLLFSGIMYAQNYHWADFDYHDFTRPMIVISRVQFNGEFQNSADIEVAAFVGDELRGRSFLFEPYPNSPIAGQYFAYAPCYYDTPGETFTFKAYDHLNNLEYDICPTTLVGLDDGHGSVENPIILNFTRTVVPSYGPDYPWIPSTAYSGEGMLVTAQVKIDGVLVDRSTYEVGAFCGDECRATSGTQGLDDWTDENLGYFAFMNVMGNNGDIINFCLYDLANNSIVPGICNATVTLVNGGELGIDIFGGDIFVLNFITEQTFTKGIAAYTTDGGYYLIASPIGEVSPNAVGNMLANEYDLYYFDQSNDNEWINYKGSNGGYNLLPGKGYLYANSGNVTLTFTGMPYSGDGQVNLSYNDSATFKGWNLVGNPFAQTAYINRSFYTMNTDGSEIIAGTGNSVGAMEGIFVVADSPNDATMTFSVNPPDKTNKQLVVSVSSNNRSYAIDRAIVCFDGSKSLPKVQLFKDNTKLYIPQSGNDYAIVNAETEGELPLSFKATKNGSYTLSFNTENVEFDYLHLIDNMTGNDVDLIATPSYSFDAKTSDYESRFKLVFATSKASDNSFAFIDASGNLIVNGEGLLQVFDALGRQLFSKELSTFHSPLSAFQSSGVYVLRLINGNDIKTQKIVVN